MGSFSTPNPPSLKKSSSSQSNKSQKSIVGFFRPKTTITSQSVASSLANASSSNTSSRWGDRAASTKIVARGSSQSLTPAPSSDAIDEPRSDEESRAKQESIHDRPGLPSPITPQGDVVARPLISSDSKMPLTFNSPSRKVWPYPEFDEAMLRILR